MTKIHVRSLVVFVLALTGFMAASAQTTSVAHTSSSATSAGQVSQQSSYQTDQIHISKDQQVVHQFRILPKTGVHAVNKTNNTDARSHCKGGENMKQPIRMEQLQIARQQAIKKGLPTTEYDNAIKETITNQAQ